MISCIEWIPRNVADPNPKRYELSKAERELLAQGENNNDDDNEEQVNIEDNDNNDDANDEAINSDGNSSSNDLDDIVQIPEQGKPLTATEIIASQQIDPSSLPKELRMDEYSDDEENNGDSPSKSDIGNILIGNDDAGIMGIDEDGQVEDIDIEGDSDDEYDDDDDGDDLDDVPDTREYMPTDVKGLEAMSFGGYSGMNEFEEGMDDGDDDNDSDVEDTNLKPDDALVIVAKTEEVCVYLDEFYITVHKELNPMYIYSILIYIFIDNV